MRSSPYVYTNSRKTSNRKFLFWSPRGLQDVKEDEKQLIQYQQKPLSLPRLHLFFSTVSLPNCTSRYKIKYLAETSKT